MTLIKQDDLISSVADALQFISYYHPVDFIRALRGAYEREESPAGQSGAQSGAREPPECAPSAAARFARTRALLLFT